MVYLREDNCRVRFNYGIEEKTNGRGEFVLRNLDIGREFKIVVRHDLYPEKEVNMADLLGGLEYPGTQQKEFNVILTPRN